MKTTDGAPGRLGLRAPVGSNLERFAVQYLGHCWSGISESVDSSCRSQFRLRTQRLLPPPCCSGCPPTGTISSAGEKSVGGHSGVFREDLFLYSFRAAFSGRSG